jgi:hypothetical protein
MKEHQAFILTFERNVVEQRLIGSRPVEPWDGPRRVARFATVNR